jgi:anthranilate phosphoribosyltransferase
MFPELLTKLLRRDDLTADEAARAMDAVMRGEAHPAHVAGLLVGLAMKGERPAELVGLARTMRAHGVHIDAGPVAVDTCGTGGDRAGTFNISTAAAIAVAATGVRVVKHGNRSVSSHCGSADVLEALGVGVTAPPAVAQRALDQAGICFCFAPTFHPAMKHAGEARRALGVPSAFNLLGPLTNPGRVGFQIVGVARPELTELMARALQQLGARRAWVVHGADGLDELSTTGYSKVSECHGEVVRTFYVHPADVGLPKAATGVLRGGDAAHNAAVIRGVLAGEAGPARDVVLLNAGAALLVCGRAGSLKDGIAAAAQAIDSGAAATTLDRLVAATRGDA